ncbi:MAG: tRNA uridine-5-carboxymethylaminomethyl(34) synthesis GTPase MnmE [Opitutaceae bacterium]|nr:tRNA uridine-5-carboxymethylaminomethyl(34) synthesis GTPase MnmE [Opitutaceae bacterium]
MVSTTDTIAALATPVGTSALALVRASGPLAAGLIRAIPSKPLLPRQARHSDYYDQAGSLIDDVIYVFFQAPHSYTGEDLLEISCHGNPFIVHKILSDLYARGCRPAEPGEFSKRAFLNGRIDLCQAEAVMDLIHAKSERALLAANQQLRGALGRCMQDMTDQLIDLLARVEAYIDFPDEDLPGEDRANLLAGVQRLAVATARLLATNHYGTILRDGLKTVILGEPNSGKSSLLNRLVGHERALVSAEAGTTRDYLEERITLGPHCIRFTDTAGLNPRPSPIEKLGMAKTLERAAEADLMLLVLDATRPVPPLPREIQARLTPQSTLAVINKIDLAPVGFHPALPTSLPIMKTSALTGAGCDELVTAIIQRAESFRVEQGEDLVTINSRHAYALNQASTCLREAQTKLESTCPSELLASDLRGVLAAFGEISGKVDNEHVLDRLFSTFCIGK